MKKGRFTEEKIVQILRDADATTTVAASREHGVSEQSIYRWRKQYGGMPVSDVRELKRLREDNARLKKLVAERDLEAEVMREIQAKNGKPASRRARARFAISRGQARGERRGYARRRGRGLSTGHDVNGAIDACRRRCASWRSRIRLGVIGSRRAFCDCRVGGSTTSERIDCGV